MDIYKIKKLIELAEKHNISKLKISDKKESITINRFYKNNNFTKNQHFSTSDTSLIAQNIVKSKTDSKEILNKNNNYIVRSPMVGIFYLTPSPEAKVFIEIGQKINIGDTLCIIEAMKMMNQIQADASGIVKAILVENGQPVEFNEPLIIIEY
ncbi:acetyl-CoA carboxylase biotin carboxyl carrier protein [Candidatus Pantoea edessiphila]|uniref:Biotin carboxyl carrier protein of acetyl-CoA carboxylase n=1 Tax=Candidatus Pantoea edessiphila TaxID=2044610 RepID=A0A2P5SXT8_9GAMM|nr:acetyl-CoA carboxylase biotin carboxyl carrier protein [Candidatus Pantoea edessiphila]MBK4775932.1 acetyl-CoA carboxylase biotin carboxyl carrier protein [Pantoea sp. Edef]PPI87112.1 acetyl-CoA carboxylase biotin carboxyl carrier protein [Candidatus Pantoea edessiphila]